MTNELKYRQDFAVTINNTTYQLTCFYQSTRSGFRHLCFRKISSDEVPNPKDYIAKCTYINRTWEAYPYESVLRETVNKIVTSQITNIVDLAMSTVRRVKQ